MRSGEGAASPARPPLLLAAIALAAEAVALLAYTIVNVVDIATNNSYQVANGAALVILQVILIAGIAWIAAGVAKVRPWTRTPAVMIQVLAVIVAIILLQAHQYAWGGLTLLLAIAALVSLLAPASLKALARPVPEPEEQAPAKAKPAGTGKPGGHAKSGNPARSGNPAKRNSAGKPVSRQS